MRACNTSDGLTQHGFSFYLTHFNKKLHREVTESNKLTCVQSRHVLIPEELKESSNHIQPQFPEGWVSTGYSMSNFNSDRVY